MKIILFTHPAFLSHQSMPRYANMLVEGMCDKGHDIEVWSPKSVFFRLPFSSLKKWLSYIDQYIVFPLMVRSKIHLVPENVLFVFADQALGPWVPLVANRKHIIHCHDFLALKSALGQIPENPTSNSGKLYQNYIRKGFSKGKNFICISKKTEEDLKQLHLGTIKRSTICYNGLSRPFVALDVQLSRQQLSERISTPLADGYIMHIGGNQYYKNRLGVLEIYERWRTNTKHSLPLLLIGEFPSGELQYSYSKSRYKNDIHFITDLEDKFVNAAYSGASCLLFPSLDEGFGWPIIEAMASGCSVITTDKAPMNEVGGEVAYYIASKPAAKNELEKWVTDAAAVVEKVITQPQDKLFRVKKIAALHLEKFTTDYSLNEIEKVYKEILNIK